ncbi:MAG: fibronectin type III domain-containing protein [Verrucomicrobia bacterium]|nr:fibronectin type III domain-containing protein [Verrucomicrobiota bacterium]
MDGGNTYANTNVSYTGSKSIYSYTISGLSIGIPYTVYTMARNSVGNSAPISTPPTILFNKPDAPVLYNAEINNRSIDISFSTPLDNGNAIVRYECSVDNMITYRDIGLPLNNQYNIPNLENGTVYSVSVRAVNYGGNSNASNTKYVIPATIPDPPVVYTLPGDRNIDISFDTPLSNGGNAITRYEYSLNNGNTYIPVGFPRNNMFNVYNLVNGNTYGVCMRAVNYRGNSLVSNIIPSIPCTVPKEPIITAVVSKHNALEIFFRPPTDNGGAPILGYKYAYILGNI